MPGNRVTSDASTETLHITNRQSQGHALVTSEGFVVLAGSSGLADTTPSVGAPIVNYRNRLIEQGAAEIRDGRFVLRQDHLFKSPSTAGAVVAGRNLNGRLTWKNEAGMTYAELEERELGSA